MQIAQLKNVYTHWREDGDRDGYPVVFANSLGTDLRLWDRVIELLPTHGFRYIRFDKRGHGLSSCPLSPYSLTEIVEDIEELLQRVGIAKCAFVGLSIGGMIGQALASRNPNLVTRLVLACTAAKMGEPAMWQDRIGKIRANGLESIADAVLERWFSPEFLQSTTSTAWRNMLTRTPAEGYIGCCEAIATADLTDTTPTLKLPVLGIGGSFDQASPPQLVRATTDLISGSQFVEIKDAGHLPCIEQPDVFAAHLRDFLKEDANAG